MSAHKQPFFWYHLAGRLELLAVHRANPQRYPFLLESVAHGTANARYDILFAFPGERTSVDAQQLVTPAATVRPFLTALDSAWSALRLESARGTAPPFRGGWFLLLGYELAAQIEPTLRLPLHGAQLPVATAVRVPAAVIYDHASGSTSIVAESEHAHLIELIAADLQRVSSLPRCGGECIVNGSLVEDPAEHYLDGVERIKRYIYDGDVFQVNLSRAWQAEIRAGIESADIYARLRETNPAPFAGLAHFDDKAVISSSPERLVHCENGVVQTRPIAGTRPRGAESASDASNRRELLAHPKERAEHIMLIDLERNDLGRIAQAGSVHVDELMVLESYSHVHHIVSNVRARLRSGVTPGALIAAVFPGGTITGCPKVRCMQIIAELEGVARGAYTGAMGYLNRDGSMDLNILIRTLELAGNSIRLRAGAGIVADSVAERELAETRAKARGMLLALTEEVG